MWPVLAAYTTGVVFGVCVGIVLGVWIYQRTMKERPSVRPAPPTERPAVPPPTPPPGPVKLAASLLPRTTEETAEEMVRRVRAALGEFGDKDGNVEVKAAVMALGKILADMLGYYAGTADEPEELAMLAVQGALNDIKEEMGRVALRERTRVMAEGRPNISASTQVH